MDGIFILCWLVAAPSDEACGINKSAVLPPQDMGVFVDDPCGEDGKRNIAPGTFDRCYGLSRSFVAELVHMGPVLVSVAVERDLSRALVRSALGFREYRYYNRHISGCPYFFCVRSSLSRYFRDTVEGWEYSEAVSARQRPSLMGVLNSLLSLGSWPLRNDLDAGRKGMYDAISTGMLASPEKFGVQEVMSRMAEVRPEHARMVDKEFYGGPVYVDVVLGAGSEIPHGMLGRRQEGPGDVCGVSLDKRDGVEGLHGDGGKGLRQALLGFVFNEVEYFCQMNEFHLVVARAGWEDRVFEEVLGEFARVHRFEKGFLGLMRDVVCEAGVDMDRVLLEPGYFADAVRRGLEEVAMCNEEILEVVLEAFEKSLDGFGCYEGLMLSHEESLEALRRHGRRGMRLVPDERALGDCFCNCLQRIVRYPILIEDILRNTSPGEQLRRGQQIYLMMARLINMIDKKKERHDNLRCGSLVRERVCGMPRDIAEREMSFLAQLSCEDGYGDPVTLFLFREMVVIADREGASASILDGSRKYFFRAALELGRMDAVAFGTSGVKLVASGDLSGLDDLCQMVEDYGDVSIGAMYFTKCSPHSAKCFIEEYCKARVPRGAELYMSGVGVFCRVLRLDGQVASSPGGWNADLVVYTSSDDFESSRLPCAGLLDLSSRTLRVKGDNDAEYMWGEADENGDTSHGAAEAVGEAARNRRAAIVSQSTPRELPHVFARYRIKLREVADECCDSAIVVFGGRLSKWDTATIARKAGVAKGIMGYLSRCLSYMGEDEKPWAAEGLGNSLRKEEATRVLEKILDAGEVDDRVLSRYGVKDILWLLTHLVCSDTYLFFKMEDIEMLYRALAVDKTYLLGASVPIASNSSLALSLFEVMLTARDKVSPVPMVEMLLGMLAAFDVGRAEVAEAVARIHW